MYEDYEFYHTDNGKFTNDAMMPIDGIWDFNTLFEQQVCFDMMEHYDYFRDNELFTPQYVKDFSR